MKLLSLILAATLALPSQAALRFGCSSLSIQRLDPLVQPGRSPSAHVHQFVGGNALHTNMSGDIGEQATCTTCTFSEDFSNYWTAVMYFKHPNGSYHRVPIMQNTALPNGINGGMTIYYTQKSFAGNGGVKVKAFAPVRVFYTTCGYIAHRGDRASVWSLVTRWQGRSKPMDSSSCVWRTRELDSPSSICSLPSRAREAS